MHPNPPGQARATARRLDPKYAPLLTPAILAVVISLVIWLTQGRPKPTGLGGQSNDVATR